MMETSISDLLVFSFFAGLTLLSSIGVVLVKDVWHSVLLLGVALLSIAIHYVLLSAEFIAAMQVLVYVGGVLILISFAIMLIRRKLDPTAMTSPELNLGPHLFRGVGAIIFFILFSTILLGVSFTSPIGFQDGALITKSIGYAMFDLPGASVPSEGFLAAFEIIDIALVAALVAAIMLARRNTTGEN